MSDPRTPIEEVDDLGPIEDDEPHGDDVPATEAEGQEDAGAGVAEDEAGGDLETVGEAGTAGDVARSRPRSQETIRSLRARAQEAEAARQRDREEFDRRVRQLEQRPQGDPQAAAREAEAEAVRVSMMEPAEQARYYYEKGQRETQQALFQTRVQAFDAGDKAAYATLKATDPRAARYENEVEQLLAAERASGNYRFSRSDILAYRIGKEVLERAGKVTPGQRRDAAGRVRAQTTRPNGAGSDAARTRSTNETDARRARLENYVF